MRNWNRKVTRSAAQSLRVAATRAFCRGSVSISTALSIRLESLTPPALLAHPPLQILFCRPVRQIPIFRQAGCLLVVRQRFRAIARPASGSKNEGTVGGRQLETRFLALGQGSKFLGEVRDRFPVGRVRSYSHGTFQAEPVDRHGIYVVLHRGECRERDHCSFRVLHKQVVQLLRLFPSERVNFR